ncbi:2OG-Fe(II) oxygenase [Verrucomicrobiota bacterium sgz303538]
MSDDSVLVTYADNFEPLVDLLTGVEHPGDYFVSGASETPLPTLKVSDVGTVAFPVPPSQARDLIDASAEKAPYGRGDQTFVDETVRKVWQISPEKISIRGSGWENTFKGIVEKVAEGLGCEAESVEAEFYKLLIYEKGGFFVAHRDSEKAGGMFGTLVVSLPSEHTGGELIVRHAGREVTIDLSVSEPGEVRFAAFYADCEHEVRPITSGYRVCLIYNLVAHNAKTATPVAPPDARKAVPEVAELLARWASSDATPRKLVYLLDHHYTQAAVSFSSLKGRDANVGRVLKEAAKIAGCHCYIGIAHIEESGSAEYYGDYYSRGRRGRWDDDSDDEESAGDYEIGEICEAAYYIDQWKDVDGSDMEFGSIPLEDNELLPPGALDDEEPDEKHFSEATGNAGASFERTYLRAAVILWPAKQTDAILVSAGTDSAITRLGQLVTESHHGAAAKRAAASESVRRVAGMVLESWGDSYFPEGKRLSSLLKALIRFEDADLLFKTAGPLIAKNYTGAQNHVLVLAATLLGFERGKHMLEELIETRGAEYPGAFMDLWIGLASSKDTSPLARALCGLIVRKLAKRPTSARYRAPVSEEGERPVKLTPALIIRFLKAVGNAETESDVESLLETMLSNPDVFTVENHLLPALEVAESEEKYTDKRVIERMWNHCVSYFLGRSEYPPQKPKDWAQPVTVPGRTPELRELERFARDPELREHRFKASEDVRHSIESTIQQLNLDMSCTTERKGRPYTLVCVKTLASFERACTRYREDIAQMRRLTALKAAASLNQAALLSRLNAAVNTRGA